MTATIPPGGPPPAPAGPGHPTAPPSPVSGFGRLLLAEWTKIRSVRSTLWTLAVFAVVSLGLTALLTWLTLRALSAGQAGNSSAAIMSDPAGFILGTGLGLGQLAICVLGAMVVTTEYSSGTIRASLLAVPRRIPMLLAKTLVFAALVLVAGEIVAFLSYFIGAAFVSGHVISVTVPSGQRSITVHHRITVSLGQPGVARAVAGAGLYLMVLGLFAMGIGTLIRHTAGAISTVVGLVLVIFPITALLPYSWGAHIHAYMPTIAGQLITSDHPNSSAAQLLSPWQGFGVFCAWTALLLAAGAYLLRRRDA